MNRQRLFDALDRPATTLGVIPSLAALRPQLALHFFEQIPSTNIQAWQLVEAGAGAGTVVIAQQQQAGRGQWGRQWVSAPGGLYLSLVLQPRMTGDDRPLLTFASAWGIATALRHFGVPVQIKWPNDLVCQGRKLGGILTEMRSGNGVSPLAKDRAPIAIVGVGINWSNPVPATGTTLSSLVGSPYPEGLTCLEDLAAVVLRGILQGYYLWQQQGTEGLLAAYQRIWLHQGQRLTVHGHSSEIIGVSKAGDLLISTTQQGQKITRCLSPGKISLGYNA